MCNKIRVERVEEACGVAERARAEERDDGIGLWQEGIQERLVGEIAFNDLFVQDIRIQYDNKIPRRRRESYCD